MAVRKSELKIAYENMMRKKKIEFHLVNLDKRIKQQEREVRRYLNIAEQEEEDIHKLEGMNLQTLFIKVLGNHLDELEKQRQEYLMAVLQHQGATKKLNALKYEKEILNKQLSGLFNAESEFDNLYKKAEVGFDLLLDKKTKGRMKAIELRVLNHEERVKEIREAVRAGKKAERILVKIKKDLSEIKQWGNPFINNKSQLKVYGKGRYSSYGKKKFVNAAKSDANKANILLEHFELEILDIYKQFKLDYRNYIKSFSNFLEIFYDNMVTDWIVKKNIDNTIHAMETIHDKVVRILAMLENEITKTKSYISEEKSLRKEIIVNYGS